MQGSANLNIMVKAARAAGRGLVRDFREVENLQVSVKGAGDFVTRADRRAEETIRERLMTERPNYGFVGEESGETAGTDPTRRWIVDPLDGTTNFLHGLPHWCISIALEYKGEIVSAVIFDAAQDELYWAEKGQGAFMNEMRLRVSGRTRMIEALVAGGGPVNRSVIPHAIRDRGRLMPATAGVREWGAAALGLAYVAAGRFDGYWERMIQPWDVAAGMLLVREAGGFVQPIAGESVFEGRTIVAATAGIFDDLAGVLRED